MSGEFVYHTGTTDKGVDGTDSCPECEGESIITDDVRGELVCEDCGCILGNRMIDTGAEWSAFSHSENQEKSRVGSPMTELLHDRGLTTKIHWKNADAQGRPLSPRKQETIKRLRTWQQRLRISQTGERNLQLALSEINRMSSALGLPEQVSEMASVIYRAALEDNLVQGRSIEAVASSSLYIACRKEGIPRSLDEFDSVARVDRNEIARTYRRLVVEQELEMEPIDPKQFVPRFCSELGMGPKVQRKAVEILADAAEEGLHSGKTPTGLAGAAIYLATLLSEHQLTQSEIAEVARVTEVTIRNRYQEQLAVVDEIES